MSEKPAIEKRRTLRIAIWAAAAACVGAALWWGPFAAFHLLPPDWTGEADRLAAVLGVRRGTRVAEIGAGAGALTLALSRRVGPEGRVFATELSAARREQIARAAAAAGASNVAVVAAQPPATGLEAQCCEAVFMRHVFHHVDGAEMAEQLCRALRPGGRLAVIDFEPGVLAWHLGPDHGVAAETTIRTFGAAGFRLLSHDPDWGGGSYMLLFEVRS